MTIFLVRHAHAQDRSSWSGDDRLRPLTDRGRGQSDRLGDALARESIAVIRSSPSVRCLQTMAPLSRHTGVAVDSDDRLAEGASGDDALALIKDLDQVAALCSHGDVIPALIDLLREGGVPITGRGCEKGSIWRLDRIGGAITAATYLGRP